MSDLEFHALLASRGRDHWWHAGMRSITWAIVGNRSSGQVLDIGCGPGWDLEFLPSGMVGVGVDVEVSPRIPPRFVLADGARAPFADAGFDLVLAHDVLEQRNAQPDLILAEAHRLLRPGGLLFIRVPAHPWLVSPHDEFWGGARRYRREELAAMVRTAGFKIRRLSYANSLLFGPAVAARLFGRWTRQQHVASEPLAPMLNSMLRQLLAIEARWLRKRDLPVGLSLVCLASRIN